MAALSQTPKKLDAIALSYPPVVIDDSSWKNTAESFTVALSPNPRGGGGGGGTKVQ